MPSIAENRKLGASGDVKSDYRRLLVLCRDFCTFQEERVKEYRSLDESHKTYLATGPSYLLEPYKEAVAVSTQAFALISRSILAICKETEVVGANLAVSPSTLIRKVQAFEEEKLKTTVDLQLAKQQALDAAEDDDLMEENVKRIRNCLDKINDNIRDEMEELRYLVVDLEESLQDSSGT